MPTAHPSSPTGLQQRQARALAFDLDAASLNSLREALPEWRIDVVRGATAASLTPDWYPGAADLLVVQAREELAETLGLCRFLAFCGVFSTDSREEPAEPLGLHRSQPNHAARPDAPLLVLVSPGQNSIVTALLGTGATHCLVLPIHAKDVASLLAHPRNGDQPGRHTLNLQNAQREDQWRDNGGQG